MKSNKISSVLVVNILFFKKNVYAMNSLIGIQWIYANKQCLLINSINSVRKVKPDFTSKIGMANALFWWIWMHIQTEKMRRSFAFMQIKEKQN